jgi:predicted negative regulator of RcsB-dependent stress response
MQRIERIYREQRDRDGLKAFYQDVLTRTDNQAIRNVAYLKLSELTVHGKDIEGALALLEQGLEENLRQVD